MDSASSSIPTREAPGAGGLQESPAPELLRRYHEVRSTTERICEPLAAEDCVVQTMTEASPTKWHLAHTSWFFETFVLSPTDSGYTPFHPRFRYLFNSYYNTIGAQHLRPERGLLSRPTVAEIHEYRKHVDRHMRRLLEDESRQDLPEDRIVLGLNHEQQHQELILTDVKHVFGMNPLGPAYRRDLGPVLQDGSESETAMGWIEFKGGLRSIGHGGAGFHFDNEGPRHDHHLQPFRLSDRLVTVREYLEFIEDGGYETPEWWLSDAWAMVRSRGWRAPLYWEKEEEGWSHLTLGGRLPIRPEEPVGHVSYYEADAFARWKGCRLPTEQEWEVAVRESRNGDSAGSTEGNFQEEGRYHPRPASRSTGLKQMMGDLWEWTSSPYSAYPGYRPLEGALGEYNGKFMCNQMVLRGGSCVTPRSHIRSTYRNFFPPESRWQFTGIRLAR